MAKMSGKGNDRGKGDTTRKIERGTFDHGDGGKNIRNDEQKKQGPNVIRDSELPPPRPKKD